MDNFDEIEMQLWAYIDGLSTAAERSAIKKNIAAHAAWRAKYKELLQLHTLAQYIELEQPPMRFTKNVMENIALLNVAPAAKKYINQKIIWAIVSFFIITIGGILFYFLSQINWSVSGSSSTAVINVINDSKKIFSGTLLQLFMIVNAVLALMLLDRFLSKKKDKGLTKA